MAQAKDRLDGADRDRETLYARVAERFSGMIARVCAGFEADPGAREDLAQEVHLQLWRSLAAYRGQASLATWTYRVAHNVCADHVDAQVRARRVSGLVDLADIEISDTRASPEAQTDEALTLERLYALVHRLKPMDRQVMLLHLEGLDAAATGDITGLTPGAVATRVHRVRALVAQHFVTEAS